MPQHQDFRQYFATQPGLIHLNNAGLSPINRPAEEIVHHWVQRYRLEGMFCNDAYLEAVDAARQELADFLDADSGSIAYFPCTSGAISQVAFELGLKPEDEVLMWDQEYGSNLYPWQEACHRSGARLVLAKSGPDLATPSQTLLNLISSKTRVIAISWVQFQSGAVTDLEPLVARAKQQNIWTVVDGIQGIGVREFSFRKSGLDVLVGGSHKWMTAPVGVGYLCIRGERARQLRPHSIGASTYGTCDDPTDLSCVPKQDALRFESGSKQVLEIVALGASARMIHSLTPEAIGRRSLALAQSLVDGLGTLGYQVAHSNGPKQATPIVNFVPGPTSALKDLDAITHALQKNKISYARRGSGIRLSPHAHNCEEDIEEALRVLGGLSRRRL